MKWTFEALSYIFFTSGNLRAAKLACHIELFSTLPGRTRSDPAMGMKLTEDLLYSRNPLKAGSHSVSLCC
jgi:hypothetical protein